MFLSILKAVCTKFLCSQCLTVVSRLEISGAISLLHTYVCMVRTGLALCSNVLMNDILLCLIQ